MKIERQVSAIEREMKVCKIICGKPEGTRLFERSRRKREDIMNIKLKKVACGDVDWIWQADRLHWRAAEINCGF